MSRAPVAAPSPTPAAIAARAGDAPAVFPADGSCPVDGDTGDPALNDQKNRFRAPSTSDVNAAVKVPADAIGLPEPAGATKVHRQKWPSAAAADVAALESTAAVVEGYILDVIPENGNGGEASNCHRTEPYRYDYHIYLAGDKTTTDKADTMVVEMTPRWQSINHPGWCVENVAPLKTQRAHVRVTGWLMFDEDHLSDERAGTRGTVWEIHPVTKFETQTGDGPWQPLGAGGNETCR
ncbi:MAG TPA: hypothetical protein VHT05_10650 [Candidatus Elarobacter sp.]|nr:hypothetical protein [Candidatus Elarobacter sp.]